VPVAVETLGPWNDEGLALIAEIARRTSRITADPREAFFLFQRISVAVQRGNAASFTESCIAERHCAAAGQLDYLTLVHSIT